MKKLQTLITTAFALGLSMSVLNLATADEKYNHFPSLAAPDLKTALCNLSQYNSKLSDITSKNELSTEDMLKVHELTYTLENALIQLTKDLETMAVELEKVHKASERLDQQTIKTSGEKYASAMQQVFAQTKCN
ncbi:DUF6746 family protein [Agaribacter marinus]|uniref:Cytochrome b562 n=1 Tax=Agaribacter marinus TaxID=1431249 RepID=A0AA37T0F9_9ALTE|nr:DUF6746 family protein [Agaribacter marinus]GLR70103.1 hypothetical protein GCM10007852_10110 [Agaribacter marinus]